MNRNTPVDTAIKEFGGVRAMARAINIDPSAISRWKSSGRIPAKFQKILIDKAKESGLTLTTDDVVLGR